ncbi:hypothetical protein BKK79_06655 [Cupriavidus sp. USMAA2-4]|nr:hypothetical protein BKK79_06655 [Cupriavidus sp. USMAA2-4]
MRLDSWESTIRHISQQAAVVVGNLLAKLNFLFKNNELFQQHSSLNSVQATIHSNPYVVVSAVLSMPSDLAHYSR